MGRHVSNSARLVTGLVPLERALHASPVRQRRPRRWRAPASAAQARPDRPRGATDPMHPAGYSNRTGPPPRPGQPEWTLEVGAPEDRLRLELHRDQASTNADCACHTLLPNRRRGITRKLGLRRGWHDRLDCGLPLATLPVRQSSIRLALAAGAEALHPCRREDRRTSATPRPTGVGREVGRGGATGTSCGGGRSPAAVACRVPVGESASSSPARMVGQHVPR